MRRCAPWTMDGAAPASPAPHATTQPPGYGKLPSLPAPAADSIVLALPVSRASAAGSPAASTLLAGAMDGGGEEALLVRRSKAKKRPAPAAPHVDVREFGGAGKFLALWRDYHDLRQNDERFGHQGYWSHPKLSDFDQDRVDEDTKTTDVKFTICSRDTKISPSNDDKRKISWQDRLALQA
ncbi:hypothetical protein PR202_ga15772 [Eleusine coracana subsp. coracana]|uniref:Uncharacterized protein n=1 Tax=Eleusine coracana subsp. coracana TaxID=191504 RepID=A0AAV5CJX2_ELECO|nr:hypothetical protein PR202_ga15772 [Eleusine coracana subsp. coracana]